MWSLPKRHSGAWATGAEFTIIDWDLKTQLLETGDIDCVWGSFTINGREDDYRWAGPYMASRQVVAVMPGSDIETIADLEGRTLAVQSTTKPWRNCF